MQQQLSLKKIFSFLPTNIYAKLKDGTFLFCNESQAKCFNIAVDQVIGKTDFDFFPRDIAKKIKENDLRIIKSGQPALLEEEAVFCGKNFTMISHKSPLKNEIGEIIGIVGSSIDISNQKIIQKQLLKDNRKKEITLEYVLENLPGHLYIKNKKGKIVLCNRQQAEYFGFNHTRELINKTDYDLYPPELADKIRENDLAIIKSKKIKVVEESISINNKPKTVISNKVPLINPDSKIADGILGISIDITKQKILEKKYMENSRELSKALEIKKEILNNMSHETRTPLQGIIGIAEVLYEDWDKLDNDKRKECVKTIVESQNRLMNFMSNLLDLSKFNSGKFSFDFKHCDTKLLAIDVLDEFKHITEPINLTIPSGVDTQVMCDSLRIKQVIRNLIANAIKHGGKNKPINVEFLQHEEKGKKQLKISVSDEGVGIPEEEIVEIFEPFYESIKTKRGSGGTGLGLSICLDIVNAHKGKIWANNKKAGGAIFYFTLPYENISTKSYALRLTQRS
jgi:two-component system, OmpR family, aerobic respiration control sensor histidine kinase ArcB